MYYGCHEYVLSDSRSDRESMPEDNTQRSAGCLCSISASQNSCASHHSGLAPSRAAHEQLHVWSSCHLMQSRYVSVRNACLQLPAKPAEQKILAIHSLQGCARVSPLLHCPNAILLQCRWCETRALYCPVPSMQLVQPWLMLECCCTACLVSIFHFVTDSACVLFLSVDRCH